MCGLISILDWKVGSWSSEEAAVEAVQRGLNTMLYRGIENQFHVEVHGRCIMGHVRLPIINLTEKGKQPMQVGNQTVMMVGEILNYKELYEDADTDTETLANLLQFSGLPGLHQVDGFWSAVVSEPGYSYAFNDYLGQKPLYYHQEKSLVASEPLAAVTALGLKDLDEKNLSNSIKWGYDPTGGTPWKGLRLLPPGTVVYSYGPERTYWDWGRIKTPKNLPLSIEKATVNRLVGDLPVGLLLSGGLDSTIIFKVLRELGCSPKVFHIENQEQKFAEIALDGYPSVELPVKQPDYIEALTAHQIPVDLGSMIPQLGLAKAVAGQGFHVCMSGDGADELFGGYQRAIDYDSQASDVFCELPYYHLPRLDRLMMRHTVELRTPFLAPEVVKYALSLPYPLRINKLALKQAFAELIPKEILDRKKLALKSKEVRTGGVYYRNQLVHEWRNIYDY